MNVDFGWAWEARPRQSSSDQQSKIDNRRSSINWPKEAKGPRECGHPARMGKGGQWRGRSRLCHWPSFHFPLAAGGDPSFVQGYGGQAPAFPGGRLRAGQSPISILARQRSQGRRRVQRVPPVSRRVMVAWPRWSSATSLTNVRPMPLPLLPALSAWSGR